MVSLSGRGGSWWREKVMTSAGRWFDADGIGWWRVSDSAVVGVCGWLSEL